MNKIIIEVSEDTPNTMRVLELIKSLLGRLKYKVVIKLQIGARDE